MPIHKNIQTVTLFANELNKNNISWALGGSMLLYFLGIETDPNDIDILIDAKDISTLIPLISHYHPKHKKANSIYRTKYFTTITILGVDVDIMANFQILTNNGYYQFPFHIEQTIYLNNTPIHLSSVEEWLNAYKMMNRLNKIELVENYLNQKIETERLIIKPLHYRETDSILEYMSDEDTLYYESFRPFDSKSLSQFLTNIIPTGEFYSIILKDTNKHIGHLYFGKTRPLEFKEYNLGYILNKKYHNKGYCTEACKALLDHAFKTMDLHRVTAKCNPDNIASWRVMEKIGLFKEGHLKNRVCFKYDENNNPIWWDELIYGITREDYTK